MDNKFTIGETKTEFSPFSGRTGCDRTTRVIHGLVCSYGKDYGKTDSAWVDASIADLLVLLNSNGFQTTYSCSGLPEDHGGEIFPMSNGYIAFQEYHPELKKIWGDFARCEPFAGVFNKMGVYLLTSTKENWEELENRLVKYLENEEAAKSRVS